MMANAPTGRETKAAYMKRLRLTALRTPSSVVLSMIKNMKFRAKKIWEADGGHIKDD